MPHPEASEQDVPPPRPLGLRRAVRLGAVGLLIFLLAALAALWLGRERLADRLIEDYLKSAGVPATYEVDQIGPARQIIRNLVIGDPKRPDLTVERVEVGIRARFGLPDVTVVRLVRPRLFGTIMDGKLSFGALDPLVFTDSDAPFEFPTLDLQVDDGRALVEGDYGPVGISLSGSGRLRDGFAGQLAAVAPRLSAAGCAVTGASLFGRVTITDAIPRFAGPMRLKALDCTESALATGAATIELDLGTDAALKAVDGDAQVALAALRLPQGGARNVGGTVRFAWNAAKDNALTLRYDLGGNGIVGAGVTLARLGIEGSLRSKADLARIDIAGTVDGAGLEPGSGMERALSGAATSAQGTLAQPLLLKLRRALAVQLPGSTLAGEYDLRLRDGRIALAMPSAHVRGRTGETLLALSRVQLATGAEGLPLFSGNFTSGGPGLPQISGRMEQRGAGPTRLRLRMAPYSAGGSSIELPELALVQRGDGALGFAGSLRASGPLPGGMVQGLVLPISGNISYRGDVSVWRSCTTATFDTLRIANLSLDRRALTLCPPRGGAIVRSDGGGGLAIAAGASSLALAGRLGETPIALNSGPVGFAYPGSLIAKSVLVTLGPADSTTSFAIQDLSARIGDDVAGTFAGTDVKLAAVPLDLLGATGNWRYADGRFTITEGAFQLVDRQEVARFKPLAVGGAGLALVDNVITAAATLREPKSGRVVTDVAIRHDLDTATGDAQMAVTGLDFDDGLQPTDLSELARGIVANVKGTVTGNGRIDWNTDVVTSSGSFGTDSLDLAAAFGPVRGASGTIRFTDLLALTTAPGQQVRIQSVNPGIEANDGAVRFQLVDGTFLRLEGGTWPFLGGTLRLQPLDMRFGNAETRRYVLEIEGLEAARFVERMELSNLAVTGTFDGTIPVVFDEEGNGRLEGGVLLARAPGGNVSYVGQLTYEDMGAIPNFAFKTLRSLDYREMFIQMDGSLVGEIVTRVRLDGVGQGAGASRNLITRQIAKLPIRLDVNVRAPFYSLISTIRRTYDPSFIPDPRSLGLIGPDGKPAASGAASSGTAGQPIQPSESEVMP